MAPAVRVCQTRIQPMKVGSSNLRFGGFGQLAKDAGIVNGQMRQYFAINLNIGNF